MKSETSYSLGTEAKPQKNKKGEERWHIAVKWHTQGQSNYIFNQCP